MLTLDIRFPEGLNWHLGRPTNTPTARYQTTLIGRDKDGHVKLAYARQGFELIDVTTAYLAEHRGSR